MPKYQPIGVPEIAKLASKVEKLRSAFLRDFPPPPDGPARSRVPVASGTKLLQYRKKSATSHTRVLANLNQVLEYMRKVAAEAAYVAEVGADGIVVKKTGGRKKGR